jgi:amino acid adenylation domain-containing protein
MTALRCGDEALSWVELESNSNRMANALLRAGARTGGRVALYAPKSLELIAALYGALKAGCVCVPVDSHSPPARVASILSDCDPAVVVTSLQLWARVGDFPGSGPRPLLLLERPKEDMPLHAALTLNDVAREAAQAAEPSRMDTDLAYILYTSGSTGTPKGVMLSHRNVLTFADWARKEFDVNRSDRVAGASPLHFDLSMFDLFTTARAGACLDIVPQNYLLFPQQLAQWLEERSISILYTVPSLLVKLAEQGDLTTRDLSALRLILFAGEVAPPKPLAKLLQMLPHAEFANLYGPTETNVCTFHRVDPKRWDKVTPLPIGRPCPDIVATVITDEGAPLRERGEVGELVISGEGVALGYWGDAERTAQRFAPLPQSEPNGGRTYRTGDYVSIDEDGEFIFRGRRDQMVKIRGYRVELGEIESALCAHPNVSEAVVIASEGERLVAFVKTAEARPTVAELLRHCAAHVPRYMLPQAVHYLNEMPRGSTGKIDRFALARIKTDE